MLRTWGINFFFHVILTRLNHMIMERRRNFSIFYTRHVGDGDGRRHQISAAQGTRRGPFRAVALRMILGSHCRYLMGTNLRTRGFNNLD